MCDDIQELLRKLANGTHTDLSVASWGADEIDKLREALLFYSDHGRVTDIARKALGLPDD